MSEELILLKEYAESLGFFNKTLTTEDLKILKDELKNAGEFGLANLISSLKSPEELKDYIGENNA